MKLNVSSKRLQQFDAKSKPAWRLNVPSTLFLETPLGRSTAANAMVWDLPWHEARIYARGWFWFDPQLYIVKKNLSRGLKPSSRYDMRKSRDLIPQVILIKIKHIYTYISLKYWQNHMLLGLLIQFYWAAMPSRLRRQDKTREEHVQWIVNELVQRLRTKGHVKRMQTTNRILPLGTLRKRNVKSIFTGWINDLEGRVLTKN